MNKKKRHISTYLLPVIFCITGFCVSQNTNFENVLDAYNSSNKQDILIELKKIDTTKINKYDKATWLYYFADYNSIIDNHHLAYVYILKSKKLFKELKQYSDVKDCNVLLLGILNHQNNLEIDKKAIISELKSYALKKKDTLALAKVYQQIAIQYLDNNDGNETLKYFNLITNLYKLRKDTLEIAKCNMNIGTVYNTVFNNQDSALYYTKKAVPYLKKYKDYQNLAYNYNNQAQQYKLLKNCIEAEKYFLKADSIPLKGNISKSKVIFYENMSSLYLECKEYKKAALHFDKLIKLKDSINDTKQNIAISKIKEQYDNEKVRANSLEIESKRKQNFNLLIGAFAFILFGGTTAFLIQKNTKRKQKLAEQEKEIEKQKVETLLKDQELISIDAMIEGQEKERQRIANDLHDDLGGLMATVKLHFNVLKDKKTPELFDKTNTLLDEAYQKVRSIAHAKNSGVIAKQGLLKAIQNMADKVSVSNKIIINVIDHDLEDRLENSLELTIFRVIQELVTNIIKHAEATEAIIHLTNHEDSLNIMIEDNGKGFNPSQVTTKNKGMGISSIDKRVEHLNGTMTIESEINKGTTIIIDIPI
ncbi:sensor histidine kinase [Flavivirga jejuensis]|uniref:Oxygen sensor histidine kinase NreB n=1 Tax=Flavivirga jejuensis TaxID=870487 RepID=A0ABT8WLJ8_9FLAO|nr:sensor histidine kinase [Flavivirga jejuensis]MDO5973988.1 sensor histidine kinase [Flavivirga jejuensis]